MSSDQETTFLEDSTDGAHRSLEELLELVLETTRSLQSDELSEILLDNVLSAPLHLVTICLSPNNRESLRAILPPDTFRLSNVETLPQASQLLRGLMPDIVLLELDPEALRAFSLIGDLGLNHPHVSIIVITDDRSKELVIQAYRTGAREVLPPLPSKEILQRSIESAIARRESLARSILGRIDTQKNLGRRLARFFRNVRQLKAKAVALGGAYKEVVDRLQRAAHWRDDETGDHIQRIGLFSAHLARRLGLPSEQVDLIRAAAPLHDIGKIGVPDKILLKPGKLTQMEFEWMKTHTLIGAEILAGSTDPLLQTAEEIALRHHEWFNGKGYPHGKKRDDIPLTARIVSVVDVYDALVHKRTYKDAVSLDQSIEQMRNHRGTHFDPDILDVFLDIVEELMQIEGAIKTPKSEETKYRIRFGLHGMTKYMKEQTAVKKA